MTDYRKILQPFLTAGKSDKDGEWRAFCPICEDPRSSKTPSASFNFDTGLWSCFKRERCSGGGTLAALVSRVEKAPKKRRRAKSSAEDTDDKKPLPSEAVVQSWSARLRKHPRLLGYVTDIRGLSQTTVKEFQIGHDGYRFTIPVRDEVGKLVNVRRYDPRKHDQDKMISWGKGHGKARIFRPDLLAGYQRVFCLEGEWDFMVGHQFGIPASTHTAGAMTFLSEWAKLFVGKDVIFCYDDDETGKRGAMRAAHILEPVARSISVMTLDTGIKGGDLTDFFIKQGRTMEEFLERAERARPIGKRRSEVKLPDAGLSITLEDSMSAVYGTKSLELMVSVAGKRNPPYLVPRIIHATCDQDKGAVCAVCPMAAFNGEMVHRIAPNDPDLVEFTDAPNKIVKQMLRDIVGARCADHVEFEVEEHTTVEELFVTNSVDHRDDSRTMAPLNRRLLHVGGHNTPINTTVRVVGHVTTDPKDQRSLFTAWAVEPTQTNLDKFKVTPELREALRVFRTTRLQSPLDKCAEIAEDLAANVTHIHGRPELHIAYDLVWHSILDFVFLGQPMRKGWLEMLVIGDTRTGKSECATQLSRHYNAGVVKSCEGATFAGIVGGMQQMNGKWMTTWGVIPLNDRRLVVLDEASGLRDKDVIENMSAIRSSGLAQLTKINQEQTSARTRMIWISNPPDGRALAEMPDSGLDVIAQLVPNPEDIARFDFAMAASSSDVDWRLINMSDRDRKQTTHKYKAGLCEALVMWAWSRTAEQVYWMPGTQELLLEAARDVGQRYVPDPPLVQMANVRTKLARVAVALAARTFSTDSSGEYVVVRHKHVKDAVRFLDMLYGMESFGYLRQSRRIISSHRKAAEAKERAKDYLLRDDAARHALLSVRQHTFRVRDFEEFGGMDKLEAVGFVRQLLEWRLIRRLAKGYINMEPSLSDLINEFEDQEDE